MSEIPLTLYPTLVLQDRYGGTYSKGRWLAIGAFDRPARLSDDTPLLSGSRFDVVLQGAHGGDGEAMEFWDDPPWWVAVGKTPNEALAQLLVQLRAKEQDDGQAQGRRGADRAAGDGDDQGQAHSRDGQEVPAADR